MELSCKCILVSGWITTGRSGIKVCASPVFRILDAAYYIIRVGVNVLSGDHVCLQEQLEVAFIS